MPKKLVAMGWLVTALTVLAADRPDAPETGAPAPPGAGWFTRFSGGYAHQFQTDIEEGDGEFAIHKFITRASVGYMPDYTKSVSLSLGYGRDAYDFSGSTAFPGSHPWDDINTLRLGIPVRWGWGVDKKWTLFAIPGVRWTAEDGADWGQAVSGGGFAGVSYRVSDSLTIGPGIGALTQLEDHASVFPVIIVNWDITRKLKLETGRGLGASQGPGLMLTYSWNEFWSFSAGGRYERLRFRLAENGPSPNGIGEDEAVPVYLGARYDWGGNGSLTVFGGVKFGGELRVENSSGKKIASSDHDPAPFIGLSVDLRF